MLNHSGRIWEPLMGDKDNFLQTMPKQRLGPRMATLFEADVCHIWQAAPFGAENMTGAAS